MANEQEDPVLGGDTPVEHAAMYHKYCAFNFDKETGRKEEAFEMGDYIESSWKNNSLFSRNTWPSRFWL